MVPVILAGLLIALAGAITFFATARRKLGVALFASGTVVACGAGALLTVALCNLM